MRTTKIGIPDDCRMQIADVLNSRLADSIDLYLQVKQAHWSVTGNNFISLHGLFDEIAATVLNATDIMAERIQQLGGRSLGTVKIVAKKSTLPDFPDLSVCFNKEYLNLHNINCPVHQPAACTPYSPPDCPPNCPSHVPHKMPTPANHNNFYASEREVHVSFEIHAGENQECSGQCVNYVSILVNVVSCFCNSLRADIEKTAELQDMVTSDILTEITRDLDKHLWQLEAMS